MAALTSVTPHSSLHPKFHFNSVSLFLNSTNEAVRFSSRRVSFRAVPSGLTIRAAATKPAKSPAEEDWKIKREVLLQKKVRSVDVKEALRLQKENNFVILDVRPEAEFKEDHPPGAINVQIYRLINPSLTAEVKLKKRALNFFLSHLRETETLDSLIDSMEKIEGEARKCYNADEIPDLSSDEFVEMMLLDGCFILALILIEVRIMEEVDSVFMGRARGPLLYSIQQDLLLLENQLPFFVLKALWKATPYSRLIDHTLAFFRVILPGQSYNFRIIELTKEEEMEIGMEEMPKHLLELVLFTLFPLPLHSWKDNDAIDIPMDSPKNLSELALYGIKVKSTGRGGSLADVAFCNGVLHIPTLLIEESTISLFKNILALEQCQNQKRSCFTPYLFFMDALVDTDKDIDLLLQAGVLRTWLNDKQALVSLLSGLNTNLLFSKQHMAGFKDILKHLNQYCRRHDLRADLMRDYYASRWDIIISILILILTIIQILFAIVSYDPRK